MMNDLGKLLHEIYERSASIGGRFVDTSDCDWLRLQQLINKDYLEQDGKGKYRLTLDGIEALIKLRKSVDRGNGLDHNPKPKEDSK